MRKKILIAIFILFSLVFVTNVYQVSARGIVSQGYKKLVLNKGINDNVLLYRTFTTPHVTTLKEYHTTIKKGSNSEGHTVAETVGAGYKYYNKGTYSDGKTYGDGIDHDSYWIETLSAGNDIPGTGDFSTATIVFHKQELGSYTTSGPYAYNVPKDKISYDLATIDNALSNSYAQKTTVTPNNNYNNSNIYYQLNRINYTTVTTKDKESTGYYAKNLSQGNAIAEYRYAIVKIGNSNVYVVDNMILSKDVEEIKKYLNEDNTTLVSDIIISKAFGKDNNYDLALYPGTIFNTGKSWSKSMKGLLTKAMGSVLNLYDNVLEFPQEEKRTVLVRHINIGKNTSISESIVNNGTRIASNHLKLKVIGSTDIISGKNSGKPYGYQEYYDQNINITQGIEKDALNDTSTYRCVGYNVSTAKDLSIAQSNIENKIKNGSYVKGTTVSVGAKDNSSSSDITVIDFYYTEYEKDVEVNHVIVDKDGYVKEVKKQQMPAGNIAYEIGVGNIYRINTDAVVKEIYQKRLGRSIKVYRRPDNILGNNVNMEYYGYETFNSSKSLESLVGKQININRKAASEVTISGDIKQVNFYYCIEQTIEYTEPKKENNGKVFVSAIEENTKVYEGDCYDEEEKIKVTSIPTDSYAKVGIKDLPRYIVGAINTKYVPSEKPNTLTINVNLKYGNETKTITYDGFKYKAAYYRVTDMAVYELQNQTIYDADSGKNNTIGNKLFSWNSKTLDKSDITNMDLTVTLNGINGNIRNNESDIENINNYVSVSIKDKYGRETKNAAESATFTEEFLKEEAIKEIDATNYNPLTGVWDKNINESEYAVINQNDKTFADNKLNEYNTALENAKANTLNKETELQNAKNELSNLEREYNRALNILTTKQNAYDNELSIMLINKKAYDNENKKLQDIKKTISLKNQELETAEENVSKKLDAKKEADEKLNSAEIKKTRLYDIHQEKISERNELQAKANCTDEVSDEVYIYMEQGEKDNLEKCKEAKRKYQENLDNEVVEKASAEYLTYLDGDYKKEKDNADNATEEYNKTLNKKSDIEKEISDLEFQKLILNIQVMTLMRTYVNHYDGAYTTTKNDLDSYRENEYKTAESEYEEYRDGGYISSAEEALNNAKSEQDVAQNHYNKYNEYRENLYSKYDEYKAKYDEYISLINSSSDKVAASLGLQVQITAQNMSVIFKNGEATQNLFKKGTDVDNSKTETIYLSDYIKTQQVVEVKTSRPEIDKELYSGIKVTKTDISSYLTTNNKNNIASDRPNGVRVLSGEATYKTKMLIGNSNTKSVQDNVYYSENSTEEETAIFNLTINKTITETYKYQSSEDIEVKYKNVEPINVYTPITAAADLTIDDSKVVNQSNSETEELSVVQLNTPFTLNLTNNKQDNIYSMNTTNKYVAGFYVKFSFDVHKVKINGKTYKSGSKIRAGTWIGLIVNNSRGKAYIEAQPYANLSDDKLEALTEENNTYTVRAVAVNATKLMMDESIKYATLIKMSDKDSSLADSIFNICDNKSYFDETTSDVVIMNRVYDFRITDLKDLDWKNVFRSTKSTTNAHTGNVYYSGTTKWNYTSDKSNSIISRPTSEIGKNPLRTLPIGPYKNTNTSYVKAPKMGYRFSFDFKVTGSYYKQNVSSTQNVIDRIRTDKKVNIATKFYYVSKDGKTYYPEYTGNEAGIYLFYKNSSGKYMRIDENGGGYELTFTPNDGYRLIEDRAIETLATKNILLGNLRNITLNYQMATITDNSSAITYYGDYKLPNSTIAVLVNKDGTYDINKPLKGGYIGVTFDINVYSGTAKVDKIEKAVILSYGKDTKMSQNTSQWDYEGFLGYTRVGNAVRNGEVSIKLEKGNWQIDNNIYQDIKGTVILYDTDQRAATDYE